MHRRMKNGERIEMSLYRFVREIILNTLNKLLNKLYEKSN